MADEGYISAAQAAKAKLAPVVTVGRPATGGIGPFFVEDVRQHLEERYGAKRLYQGGLAVHTSLDAALQRAAEQAFDAGLRRIDKRRGFRKPARNVIAAQQTVDGYKHERWTRPIAPGDILPAVVAATSGEPTAPRGRGRCDSAARRQVLRRGPESGLRLDAKDVARLRQGRRRGVGARAVPRRGHAIWHRPARTETRSSKVRSWRSTTRPARFAR